MLETLIKYLKITFIYICEDCGRASVKYYIYRKYDPLPCHFMLKNDPFYREFFKKYIPFYRVTFLSAFGGSIKNLNYALFLRL